MKQSMFFVFLKYILSMLFYPDQISLFISLIKFYSSQCALLKLIQGFSTADFYELLNSIIGNVKYSQQCLINTGGSI